MDEATAVAVALDPALLAASAGGDRGFTAGVDPLAGAEVARRELEGATEALRAMAQTAAQARAAGVAEGPAEAEALRDAVRGAIEARNKARDKWLKEVPSCSTPSCS